MKVENNEEGKGYKFKELRVISPLKPGITGSFNKIQGVSCTLGPLTYGAIYIIYGIILASNAIITIDYTTQYTYAHIVPFFANSEDIKNDATTWKIQRNVLASL